MLLTDLQKAQLEALKNHDTTRLNILRLIIAAAKNKQIDKGAELTEEDVVQVLRKQAKELQESIDMYTKGNKPEEVEELQKQLAIVEELLPKELSDEELEKEVQALIAELKNKGEINPKTLIPTAVQTLKSKASGARIVAMVQKLTR